MKRTLDFTDEVIMPNRLNLPPELDSLIEKRDAPDRREQERRDDQDAAQSPQTDTHSISEERRSKADRREQGARRQEDETFSDE